MELLVLGCGGWQMQQMARVQAQRILRGILEASRRNPDRDAAELSETEMAKDPYGILQKVSRNVE